MQEKELTIGQLCKSTGLSEFSLNWILDNGFTSDGTLKALAIAADVELKDCLENGIEFIRDARTATVQFSQGRFKTRIKKLAERYPECEILVENPDGVLLAHIPVEWIRINPGVELTEEQKQKRAEAARRNFNQTSDNRCETV